MKLLILMISITAFSCKTRNTTGENSIKGYYDKNSTITYFTVQQESERININDQKNKKDINLFLSLSSTKFFETCRFNNKHVLDRYKQPAYPEVTALEARGFSARHLNSLKSSSGCEIVAINPLVDPSFELKVNKRFISGPHKIKNFSNNVYYISFNSPDSISNRIIQKISSLSRPGRAQRDSDFRRQRPTRDDNSRTNNSNCSANDAIMGNCGNDDEESTPSRTRNTNSTTNFKRALQKVTTLCGLKANQVQQLSTDEEVNGGGLVYVKVVNSTVNFLSARPDLYKNESDWIYGPKTNNDRLENFSIKSAFEKNPATRTLNCNW